MQLPIKTKQRAAYQPMVNRIGLAMNPNKKFSIHASKGHNQPQIEDGASAG